MLLILAGAAVLLMLLFWVAWRPAGWALKAQAPEAPGWQVRSACLCNCTAPVQIQHYYENKNHCVHPYDDGVLLGQCKSRYFPAVATYLVRYARERERCTSLEG